MSDTYNSLLHWINGLTKEEWLYVLVAVVVVGFFCLRGFGSRKDY